MFTFFLHKRTGILSEIDRRQSQNQKSRVSTQMGDAVKDRFSHGFKKQLKKLMEENYRWMILLLRSLSKKSLNPHNTFWKFHCWLVLELQSSLDAYCWDREGTQKRCLLNLPNMQLRSTNKKSEQNCEVKVAYMQFHVCSLYIKQQKRYKKEHKYWHSSLPSILEPLNYMFKLLKPELMKYLTPTSHSASL